MVEGLDEGLGPTSCVWAGLDGCRSGWVLALIGPTPRRNGTTISPFELSRHDRLAEAMAAAAAAGAGHVGLDMPIGLSADGLRRADQEARTLLGARRSTVFPTPARAVLGAADYPEALLRSRRATGKGLSIQAWNLMAKIAEVDAWIDPGRAERVFEVHPELAFARLAGAPLPEPKKTPAGRARRLVLLGRALGLNDAEAAGLAALRLRPGVAPDDLLDALAVACSTRTLAAGSGMILGDNAADERGLIQRICF